MPSRNPVFRTSKAFAPQGYASFNQSAVPTASAAELEQMYGAPPATTADTGRMSIDDVVVKTAILFAVLLPTAAIGWFLQSPILLWGGLIVGFVLSLVISFKQSTSPALILPYAAAEGFFLGGISWVFEQVWPGIVAEAVLGTLAVFVAALLAFRSGKIRVTPKFRRTVLIAMGGYLLFGLVNLVVIAFGGGGTFGLQSGGLGIVIGVFAIGLAATMLVLDFDYAQQGVRNGLPERYSWLAAFGLLVTLVWLYLEILRLLAILRGND